jgi:hypothetical protein
MITYCPNCRKEAKENADTCRKCNCAFVLPKDVPPKCPSCKKLFAPGETICRDCLMELDVFFSPSLSASTAPIKDDVVTVFESSSIGELAVIKSLLEKAGVNYFARGENVQNLFGVGLVGGFNPLVGAVKIDILKSDLEKATFALHGYL